MSNSLLPTAVGPRPRRTAGNGRGLPDRIEAQLRTLERLLAHLPGHGADEQARGAAQANPALLDLAGPNHHEDEERTCSPCLPPGYDPAEAVRADWIMTYWPTMPGWPLRCCRADNWRRSPRARPRNWKETAVAADVPLPRSHRAGKSRNFCRWPTGSWRSSTSAR